MEIEEFQGIVYDFYHKAGRSFPWRESPNPWGVLVSEFMLQQTQTERVVGYYTRFLARWPSPQAMQEARLEEVLREWSGLGYNRRARYLRDCAGIITSKYQGIVPRTPEELRGLPGIGPYTAGAVPCFAYNEPQVFIETNIRSVILHFFFQGREDVKDREMLPILEKSLDRKDPRTWYYALMDYGVALKKVTPNPGRRSAHYKTQGGFEGSFRQLRGSLMRSLLAGGPGTPQEIFQGMDIPGEEKVLYQVLEDLKRDLLVAESEGIYRIREAE